MVDLKNHSEWNGIIKSYFKSFGLFHTFAYTQFVDLKEMVCGIKIMCGHICYARLQNRTIKYQISLGWRKSVVAFKIKQLDSKMLRVYLSNRMMDAEVLCNCKVVRCELLSNTDRKMSLSRRSMFLFETEISENFTNHFWQVRIFITLLPNVSHTMYK